MRKQLKHFPPVDAVDAAHFKGSGTGKVHTHDVRIATSTLALAMQSPTAPPQTQARSSSAPRSTPTTACTPWPLLISSPASACGGTTT
eukprot:3178920-Pleurochrysis_carterae.AAC.1